MERAEVLTEADAAFDLLEVYDYTSAELELDLAGLMGAYSEVIVVAWSLGVWACGEYCVKSGLSFSRAIAVNGTLAPISEDFGLSPDIFYGTAENWTSEDSRYAFNRRMCRGRDTLELFAKVQPQRQLTDQRDELIALGERIGKNDLTEFELFDTAIIGGKDKIFLPDRQTAFWQTRAKKVMALDIAHWPIINSEK